MATGFGVDPTKNAQGVITSGTSSRDLRVVVGGMYNQGILRGCEVATSTSGLEYKISGGSCILSIGNGGGIAGPSGNEEHVMLPIYPTTVTTTASGASPRTDFVYVKQNIPSIDGNSNIVYGVTSTRPGTYDQRLVIQELHVPANMTGNTSKAVKVIDRNYATPVSTGGKYLVDKRDTYDGLLNLRDLNDLGASFYLATDRLIRVDFTVTVDCDFNDGIQEALYSFIHIDGVRRATFSTGKIDDGWTKTISNSYLTTLSQGNHNITLKRDSTLNDKQKSKIRFRYSSIGGFPGQTVQVTDCGVKD